MLLCPSCSTNRTTLFFAKKEFRLCESFRGFPLQQQGFKVFLYSHGADEEEEERKKISAK